MINWQEVKALPWRRRNAQVEAEVRAYMATVATNQSRTTHEVAAGIAGETADKELLTVLNKLAKWLTLATRDGDKFWMYGKQFVRWRWHGQKANF